MSDDDGIKQTIGERPESGPRRNPIAAHWVIPMAVCLIGGLAAAAFLAVSANTRQTAEMPPPYKEKTAAQWIKQLQASSDGRARAEAAEALGFMAREGKMTYGGFSDVPYDASEPSKLGEDALLPIVTALIAGLNDSDGRVRASSAIAVSWIGSRAKAAVPALIPLLESDYEDARKNAVTAIGRIGPPAKEALAHLQPMLALGSGYQRAKVAEALRLIGAAPDTYVPTLIEILSQDGYAGAHYAAMQLGQLGDPAVAALKQALQDKNSTTRKYAAYALANMAGWDKLTKDRESVTRLLLELVRDDDPDVVFKAMQAIGSIHAAPDLAVPALVLLLKHKDQSIVDQAADSLGEYGAEAKWAIPDLIASLGDGSAGDPWRAASAIRQIGIDRAAADSIRKLKIAGDGSWLLVPLCEFPEAAVEFLQGNPGVVNVPAQDHDVLIRLMREPDPKFKPLQEMLYKSEHLPLAIIAELGEPRFLPLLERMLKTADAHAKTLLEACARACGAAAQRVVTISESNAGDFKPKSAWPGTDPSRKSPEVLGHGDGATTVIITGRILREKGTSAVAPKFYRINDSMLLGERMREEVPIRFDKQTGRFVFVTEVFAAYSDGDGQPEPGPYQTGSSIVLIESAGCNPLQVRFYDEMPDVLITLSARKGTGK